MTDQLTDKEGKESLYHLLAFFGGNSRLTAFVQVIGFPPRVLRDMWRTTRGRESARQIAFRDLPYNDFFRLPMFLLASEELHQGALLGELTSEQDKLIWQLVNDGFSRFAEGKLTIEQLGRLGSSWKGSTGIFGWAGVKDSLDRTLLGPTAYVLGHRYLNRLKKSQEAKAFFETARESAPTGSILRRLAQAELDRLQL